MTVATHQQTTQPKQHTQQGAREITAQLVAMFGDDEGWIETWHGHTRTADTTKIDLDTNDKGRRWFWLTPTTRPTVVDRMLGWGRLYGNAYISTTLYERPERSRQWARPSRVLFVDDGPEHAPLAYSMAVQTSADKRQPYYLLTEPVDPATRQDMQRRIAYALGADKSGHDIEQLGRIPGTFNTKHGRRYPVTLRYADGPRYSLGELAVVYPPVAHAPDAGTIDTTGGPRLGRAAPAQIDDQELARCLGNVDAIMRRIRPGTPTYQTLHSNGGTDRSVARWATACNLRKFWGLPNVEIAAVLLTYCDWGHSTENGSAWLYDDVRYCIGDAEREHPHVTPSPTLLIGTKASKPLPCVARPSRARQDRPQRVTDDQYLADCITDMNTAQQVKRTRREQAARYSVTVCTIDRIERRLRERGATERFTSADRRHSWLAIYAPAMMIVPSPEDADAAETAPEVPAEVLSGPQRTIDAHTRKEKHTAPIVPPLPQAQLVTFPTAAAAVREAFAAYRDEPRITQRKIDAYLMAVYPGAAWDDAALDRWYGIELTRRQRDKQRAAQLAALPTMLQAKLKRLDRWCDRLLSDGPNGPDGAKYYMARWLAPHVAAELASEKRQAAIKRTKVRPGRRSDISVSSPAAVQTLTLFDATVLNVNQAPEVTKSHTVAPMPVQVGQCVTLSEQALQSAQDAPGESMTLEPLCNAGTLMQSPPDVSSAADGLITPWMLDHPMDALETVETPCTTQPAGNAMHAANVEHQTPIGSPGAVCSPLPVGVPVSVPIVLEGKQKAAAAFIPVGGWTPESIAALPGVARGSMAADDPWIVLQRELTAQAVHV